MKQRLLGILILAICVVLTGFGGGDKDFRIPHEKYVLANGLNVILHVDRSNPITAVYIVYHVGSARSTTWPTRRSRTR